MHKRFEGSGIIVQETKEADKEKYLESANLIFGIDKIVKQGVDIPRLDFLIFAHPMKDVEQALGRLTRFHPDKPVPVAVKIYDEKISPYLNMCQASKKYMTSLGNFKGIVSLKELSNIL